MASTYSPDAGVSRRLLRRQQTIEEALDAAVAIEILHNYSLVHDDIEDGDELRHGRTTIWAQFGIPHGINAGDALCAISYLTLLHEEAVVPSNRVVEMLQVLHEANLRMCEGQGLDIGFETLPTVSMDQYLEMIAGKTGALFAASCELGALAAGAEPARAAEYAKLGRAYGRAFQIRDDVLGTWGSSSLTGKPSGADIGVAALERLGARAAADEMHDRALAEAGEIAGRAALDRENAVRNFLARGARRVA